MAEEKQTSEVQPAPPPPATAPTVRDQRMQPEGVVPKQAQGYVVAGLAVLILLAVMFSKNHARTELKIPASPPMAASTDANQQRIHELEQDLSADQRQSEQAQQARGNNLAAAANGVSPAAAPAGSVAAPAGQLPPAATEQPRDPIADAEKALAFKARFASNLVSGDDGAARLPAVASDSADAAAPVGVGNASAAARLSGLPQQAPAAQAAAAGNKRPPEVNVNSAHGQPYVVFEGTTIDTVLVNRLDGDFVGPVKVMVSNPVYSQDRQHVLIPAGTFILGDVQKVSGFGQKRLAVTFHRLLMPDGYSVDLDQFHGLDQVGDTGLKDKVNNHYVEIFGASIALGLIAGAAESTTYGSYTESGSDMYRQGMASSLAQSGANVLDRFINIPPIITIREGHRIKVYITQDMLLPAYENHDMPGVM
jgi:type IV secretory pathway VirB10-like protein